MEQTPAQLTFTPEVPVKLYMNPKPSQVDAEGKPLSLPQRCKDLGIDADPVVDPTTNKKKALLRVTLKKMLRRYHIKVTHGGDDLAYLQSDCFVGAKQDIS